MKYVLCLLWCCYLPQAFAESYTVVVYKPNNPPYVVVDDPWRKGIFVDLFDAIGRITGDSFTFVHMPVARALKEFDKGKVDIEPGVTPDWRRHMSVLGHFSIPYEVSQEVVIFAPGKSQKVNKPADLYDKAVGTVRGFSYPHYDAAFASGMIHRVDGLSQTQLIEQLLAGRLDQAFVGLNTIRYFAKVMPKYRVLEIGQVVDEHRISLRVHPDHKALMPRLNEAISQLLEQGVIDQIYANYR